MSELVPLATAEQARALTDQIKVAVEGTWQMIQRAYISRAWTALGYSSWDDYCTREFGTSRLRLPREERQEVVASMREIGMSTRAIASATGNSTKTITKDLRQVSQSTTPGPTFHEPEEEEHGIGPGPFKWIPPAEDPEPTPRVNGTDGKSYAAKPTKTPSRPPLPGQFLTVATDMGRLIARLERLQNDDRYRVNRAAIADQCVPNLRRAGEVIQDLLEDLAR